MSKGHIGVTTDNLFPIIKKFLYSEHDIFLRELVSNAVDASQKLKTLASIGEFKGEIGELKVSVSLDKENKTITVSDNGIGMTAEEVDKYLNQIAFSGASEFVEKYKDKANAIIGHFGLGFYSAFMVAKKVEVTTLSYKEGAQAVKWSCDGSPEFELVETERAAGRGTDIVLHLAEEESETYVNETHLQDILKKYCKFLPVPIVYGKKKEWKDGKEVETAEDNQINDTNPAWTHKPSDLKQEDYDKFYRDLYPYAEDPLFHIHLNVDYPFNLTGILYFPKLKQNLEIQKNKIQLYCNQVFVTDSVEGIVPDYLTLLHGVIDSPDIPLNVSRSYLQGDPNVKKIASHITKKVADSLYDIFKSDRPQFESKWQDLKIFIVYGMLTDEKFYERAEKFVMFKNTDGKLYTFEEYKTLIGETQKDKNNTLVYLYASDAVAQHTYIDAAKSKGYDVLLMDGHLDMHFINNLETKFKESAFKRVDADVIDKLIAKEESKVSKLTADQQADLTPVFSAHTKGRKENLMVVYESLGESNVPVMLTQSEWMRRMKEMSAMGGGGMNFYGELPDSFNLVVNTDHALISRLLTEENDALSSQIAPLKERAAKVKKDLDMVSKKVEGKKDEEIATADKDLKADLEKQLSEVEASKEELIGTWGKDNKVVKQLVDLALLSNNMLKGEDLTKFVKRSLELIK